MFWKGLCCTCDVGIVIRLTKWSPVVMNEDRSGLWLRHMKMVIYESQANIEYISVWHHFHYMMLNIHLASLRMLTTNWQHYFSSTLSSCWRTRQPFPEHINVYQDDWHCQQDRPHQSYHVIPNDNTNEIITC